MSPAKSRAARSKNRKPGFRSRSGDVSVARSAATRTDKAGRPAPILPYLSIALGTVCLLVATDLLSRPVVGFASAPSNEPPSVSAGLPKAGSIDPAPPKIASLAEATELTEVTEVTLANSTAKPDAKAPHGRLLERVALERVSGLSQLQLESDGPAEIEFDSRDDGRVLEISIEAKSLEDPSPGLDLDQSPIRSLRTRRLGDRTLFTIRFDEPHEVRTRWSESEKQSIALIDFVAKDVSTKTVTEPAFETPIDPLLADAYVPHPVATRSEPAPAAVSSPGPLASSRLRAASGGRVPRSKDSDLQITRSAADGHRVDRENAARTANEAVRAGQIAYEDGDLEKAALLYRTAIATVPGHRRAIFATASVLVELNRLDEAIEIVREARRNTRDEAGLTMLHAQLIERSGDLGSAIQILDRAGQNPTEAPDVHALAAAYLQQAGEHELAIARYENLLRRYPNKPRWWMGLGISFEAAGRNEDALDVYRIAMQVGELPVPTRRWISAQIDTLSKKD